MFPNRVAHGDGSTFSREKRYQSAMMASSGFKGSCDNYSKPGHKEAQCFKYLYESGGGPLHSSGAGRSSRCSLHNTHLHDNVDCHAQKQQRGNGSGYNSGNNNSGIGNRRRYDDDSNTSRANTSVTLNGTSSPIVTALIPAAALPAPDTTPLTPVTF